MRKIGVWSNRSLVPLTIRYRTCVAIAFPHVQQLIELCQTATLHSLTKQLSL